MRLFKRKILRSAQDDRNDKPSLHDKAAAKIAGFGIKVQTKFADRMNKSISGISIKRMKIFLFLFCLVNCGLSLYYIANAVFNHENRNATLKIDHVDVPKHFSQTGDELTHPEIFVDEETMQNIKEFKQYMDSLKTNENKLYDSIMIARPGLMDSIAVLEQIYNSQKIK